MTENETNETITGCIAITIVLLAFPVFIFLVIAAVRLALAI